MVSASETAVQESKQEAAHSIVKRNMWWAGGFGLIPVPVVDLIAVTGIQLKMLTELCRLYNVRFSRDLGKNLIGALIGGALPSNYSLGIASLVKGIPVVGPVAGALAMPVCSGASTYAVGKVFIQHFESGGTLLTFDPKKVKEYFQEQFREGERLAAEAKKKPA